MLKNFGELVEAHGTRFPARERGQTVDASDGGRSGAGCYDVDQVQVHAA